MKIGKKNFGRVLLAALLTTGVAACSNDPSAPASSVAVPATPVGPDWSLRLPPGDIVVYRGEVNFDQAGTKGPSMLYPAGFGAAGLVIGLVAGVTAHAVVESSIRSGQKTKIQEKADLVLQPYHDVLASYDEKDLYAHAVSYMQAAGSKSLVPAIQETSNGRMLITDPVFSMTQDQSAIVLDAAVTIYDRGVHGEDAKPAYQNTIRVVSPPRGDSDLVAYWNANGGQPLKDQSARLFARCLDLAIADMAMHGKPATPEPVVYKSIHYADGRIDKVERGQPIAETADGTVLRNLRGWIMFVPPRPAPVLAAPAGPASVPPVDPAVQVAIPVSAPAPAADTVQQNAAAPPT